MAEEKKQEMLDPIAYREDYDKSNIIGYDPMADLNPEYLANMDYGKVITGANQSFNQYGDDSSKENQATPGGMNEKYTGEGVKNSEVNYNPDLLIKDLNPNFVYGWASQVYGSDHPGYIAQRNDDIASALYNEGKVNKDDVAYFLSQQNGWSNSTESDRNNTIESVYKRLGQIAEQNPKEEEEKEEPDLSKADSLVKDTSGKIYGKTTAEEGNPREGIETTADANSAFRASQVQRANEVKSLASMSIESLAAAIWSGELSTNLQSLRDYQQLYPEQYALVQQEVKRLRGQNAINDITNGNYDYTTADAESKEKLLENDKKAKADSVADSARESEEIVNDLNKDLDTNPVATTAEDTMAKLTDEMNKLKTRLKNLRKEANSIFKGDVPDYIVNSYINNRTQEINDRLKELQYDYDAAYNRNRDAINDMWTQKNYDLNVKKYELDVQQQAFNQWYQQQTLNRSNVVKDDKGGYWQLNVSDDGTLYYTKVDQVQTYSDSGMKGKGLKNNNPGNIKDDDFGNVVGHDDSGFAIFATPEDGFDALVEKVKFNQTNPNSRYYGKTIREYFRIYAPSSDGNNPDAYANSVAKQLGVSVDTPISELDPVEFAKVIAKHDSGYDYESYGKFRGNAGNTDATSQANFTDRDYKNFEKFINPETSASDKKVLAQQYGFGEDLEGMTKFVNNALDNKADKKKVDVNNIEIPDDIYIKDNGYMEWKVDPNSEEGKKLKQEYIDNYIKENGLSTDTDNNGAMKTVRLSSGEEYKMPMDFYRYIYNPIPSRQKDSDEDKRGIIEDILELYNQGLTASEAFLVYNGIDLNSEYADTARTLINYVMGAGKDIDEGIYSSLVYNLANNDIEHAITAVENFVMPDDMKGDLVDIAALAEKISDFIELTNNPEYTKYFGPFDSPINKEIGKVAGNPEAVKAYADLGNIYADIRQALMGNAMTEHEAETYAPILAESNENLSTIIQKLNSTLQGQMARYNAIRGQFGLPRLNLGDDDLIDMVLYPSARVRLYEDDNAY